MGSGVFVLDIFTKDFGFYVSRSCYFMGWEVEAMFRHYVDGFTEGECVILCSFVWVWALGGRWGDECASCVVEGGNVVEACSTMYVA